MCKSCVGSELSPASGSIYKSDTARNDSTLWNAEGKQYKNLKAEWYDINALLSHWHSQSEIQGLALSGSNLLLNSYCSAFFFLAASGT